VRDSPEVHRRGLHAPAHRAQCARTPRLLGCNPCCNPRRCSHFSGC
jgi:hypothetical protein